MLEVVNKKWSQFKYYELETCQCSCLSPQTNQGDENKTQRTSRFHSISLKNMADIFFFSVRPSRRTKTPKPTPQQKQITFWNARRPPTRKLLSVFLLSCLWKLMSEFLFLFAMWENLLCSEKVNTVGVNWKHLWKLIKITVLQPCFRKGFLYQILIKICFSCTCFV